MSLPDPVRITCPLCNRYGRYRLARYLELAGTTDAPSALPRFAAQAGCPRAIRQVESQAKGVTIYDDRCAIIYDLRPEVSSYDETSTSG